METGKPKKTLSVMDAAAVLVGIVIGAGIFKFPSLVAGFVNSPSAFLGAWVLGGVVSLVGALCYAELATTYPDAGGEYHYLGRALGSPPAFLFAWTRMTVIQTGSIAIQAFVIGDYASQVLDLGAYSSSIYAGLVVAALTALNIAGLRLGKWTQNLLTACVVLGLLSVAVAGFLFASPAPTQPAPPVDNGGGVAAGAFGMAMVFVLLTYGGWNETSYLSAEIRGGRRGIVRVLLLGIAIVTVVYLVINLALLRGLGFQGIAASQAVAADLMRAATGGDGGARFISVVIVVAALSTTNATVLTGARTNYALGRDFPLFAPLGRWSDGAEAPRTALLVQGAIALALVLFGAIMQGGVQTMVDYTLPVFWLFFLLVGVSLIVLRFRDPDAPRPFKVPLYPLTPLLFCLSAGYMLWSGLQYAGMGARLGLIVLAAGTPLLLLSRARARRGAFPGGAGAEPAGEAPPAAATAVPPAAVSE